MIRKLKSSVQPDQSMVGAARPRSGLIFFTWVMAILMVAWLAYVVLLRTGVVNAAEEASLTSAELASIPQQSQGVSTLPEFMPAVGVDSLFRAANLHTIIPDRPRTAPQKYEVEAGDSVFGIAKQFKLKPETVLWANYNLLNDNPNLLSTGQELVVPAADGVLYTVKDGDTLAGIASKYKANVDDIIGWPDNKIDIAEPKLVPGATILIPGGIRETRSWVVPTIWRKNSGANKTINAACDTSNGTAYGTGGFLWPTVNHSISGNDFWSGHLGIDIAAAFGAPVYAADSGVVVYAAGISGGYGLMVMIDHGNGYHTLYAHLSTILVRCGQNVYKGNTIAYSGSSGNSTGPHLHFEIRYLGAFVNPHDYVR